MSGHLSHSSSVILLLLHTSVRGSQLDREPVATSTALHAPPALVAFMVCTYTDATNVVRPPATAIFLNLTAHPPSRVSAHGRPNHLHNATRICDRCHHGSRLKGTIGNLSNQELFMISLLGKDESIK
ncbi:hypothetical protein O6H91_01G103500 [Diphasiastrum complanatum]|uniref:Uncharacterized protein n=1 Tax=Diphasiastrum complanatum TaxID=34168 RepID=A0ACC2EU65_DIPCM|nr:hypothetical protein O6H91_01G103500 [Diphasiastrum complanatum]